MTGAADISGCLDRLDWTEKALRELNGLSRRLPLLVGRDWKRLDTTPFLIEASLSAANIVHQLRSALDNLAEQLTRLNGFEPTVNTAFPLMNIDGPKAQKRIRKKLKGVKREHIDAIKRCQPYLASPGPIDEHPLKLLEDLWNEDKHHLLVLVESVSTEIPVPGNRTIDGECLMYEEAGWDVISALRQALAGVDLVLRGFVPAFSGEAVDFEFTHRVITERASYFRSRDPSETLGDDRNFLIENLTKLDRFPEIPPERRQRVLDAAERVLADSIGYCHLAWVLLPVRDRLKELQGEESS